MNCYIEHAVPHDWGIWSLLHKHVATPFRRILKGSHALDVCITKIAQSFPKAFQLPLIEVFDNILFTEPKEPLLAVEWEVHRLQQRDIATKESWAVRG